VSASHVRLTAAHCAKKLFTRGATCTLYASFLPNITGTSCLARTLQNFKRAVEEAKEIADRRKGIEAATSHHPVDFLDHSTYPDSGDEEEMLHNKKTDLR